MTIQDFSDADWRTIKDAPGMGRLLAGVCGHCHRPYFTRPCAESDHFRTCIDLAIEADSKPWISFACQHPAEQQAAILPENQKRRHPYNGRRPEWSGYCTVDSCACSCHIDEAPEFTIEIKDVV